MASLIFHLSRDYLTQDYVEQFMELGAAFGVEQLVLVTEHQAVAEHIRNIRPRTLAFTTAPDLRAALRITDGAPVYLSEQGAPLALVQWPERPVFIVGDDRREVPDRVLADALSVAIPVKEGGNLWSQQAAAIVISEWYSR